MNELRIPDGAFLNIDLHAFAKDFQQPALIVPDTQEMVTLVDKIGNQGKSRITGDEVTRRALLAYDDPQLQFLSSEMKGWFDGQAVCIHGSGPSIERTLQELLELVAAGAKVCAINGAHDWLLAKGIVPQFAVVADPKPWVATYQTLRPETTYLVASSCHEDTIAKYRGHPKTLIWHALGAETEQAVVHQSEAIAAKARATGNGCYMNTGGSTTTMRAMDMMSFWGFREQHFFGVDSSGERKDGETTMHGHSKPHVVAASMRPVYVHDPVAGKDLAHEFWSNGPMEHQAIHWEMVLRDRFDRMRSGDYPVTKIVVHGDGLWPAQAAMYDLHHDPTYIEHLRAEGYREIPSLIVPEIRL